MAIELNNRTKILAGVVVLAAAGAGAWFFFLEDFLNPPPPKPAAAKSVPAAAPKQAAAAKPAADAPKQAADAPKQAAAPKPGAKPIPTDPAKLVAEVVERSAVQEYFKTIGRELMVAAASGVDAQKRSASPDEYRAMADIANKVIEPAKIAAELTAKLKGGAVDDERLARFLEILRQPAAVRMAAPEMRGVTPEAMKEYTDSLRRNPPPAARVKLIQSLDEATRTSEVGVDMANALARDMVETMLDSMKKAGKSVPEASRQAVGAQLNSMRNQARAQIRAVMYVMYRKASDEEVSEYLKLLDTDTGRWGMELLTEAIRPALAERGGVLGRGAAQIALARMSAGKEKGPAAPQPVAQQQEKVVEKPAEKPAAAPAAPAEAPGYQRAANIREVYSRYNDVISATVMRDQAAVKELLDDGKNPNLRQGNGFTPLMIAASNGDSGIAQMLLAKGADPNPRAGGKSALTIAKSRGSAGAEMVRLLERSGAKD